MKNKRKWPKWLVILSWGVAIFFLLLVGSLIITSFLQTRLSEKLKNFSPFVKISFSSVNISLFTSSVTIDQVNVQYQPRRDDPQHQHVFYFAKVALSGIGFFKLLVTQNASVNKLQVEGGTIRLDEFLLSEKDTVFSSLIKQIPRKEVDVKEVDIAQTNVSVRAAGEDKLVLKGGVAIGEIKINDLKQPLTGGNLSVAFVDSHLSGINCNIAGIGAALQVNSVDISSRKDLVKIGLVKITRRYNKAGLNAANDQAPQMEGSIDGITITGLDWMQLAARKFVVAKVVVRKADGVMISKGARQVQDRTPAGYAFGLDKLPVEINIDSLKIERPSLVYKIMQTDRTGKPEIGNVQHTVKKILISHLTIADAVVAMRVNNVVQLSLKANVNIDKIRTDSIRKSAPENAFYFDQVNCMLSDIRYVVPHTYYVVQIKKLLLDSKRKTAQINSLRLTSSVGKYELGNKLGHQADYIEATVASIKAKNLDVLKLPAKQLIADDISISESKIYVFRDRRLPRLLLPQPLPVTYLKSLPIMVRVKSFRMEHSSVAYEEFPKNGTQTGTLKIENLTTVLSPLINHPEKSDGDYMTMNVHGSIMGSGGIDAIVRLPLRLQQYSASGAITNLDLTSLNSSAENLGKFHIESGLLNNLSFQFGFDDKKATGKIVGEYHNLVIDKLKGDNKKVAVIPSFLLKKLIIPKNKDKSLPERKRTGKIDYKRDPSRFVSFYLVKALLTGIRSSFTLGFLLPK